MRFRVSNNNQLGFLPLLALIPSLFKKKGKKKKKPSAEELERLRLEQERLEQERIKKEKAEKMKKMLLWLALPATVLFIVLLQD